MYLLIIQTNFPRGEHNLITVLSPAVCYLCNIAKSNCNVLLLCKLPHGMHRICTMRRNLRYVHGKSGKAHFRKEDGIRLCLCRFFNPCLCSILIFCVIFKCNVCLCNCKFHRRSHSLFSGTDGFLFPFRFLVCLLGRMPVGAMIENRV